MQLPDYETLLERCTAALPDGVDKREGSLIHMAMAPVCLRLAEAYVALTAYYDLIFSDTAAGEYLDRLAGQYGIFRKTASAALRRGSFTDAGGNALAVPVGSRFYIDNLFFRVEEALADGYSLCCETAGAAGNHCFGAMQPAEYLDGLVFAELGEVLVPGEDEEDDGSLRSRLSERLSAPAFGGNVADYREKTKAISGVGAVRVTPAAEGGGTVTLTVLDSEYLPAGETLLALIRESICGEGNGLGLAPIGHTVTVESAEGVGIAVAATVTASGGESAVTGAISAAIEDYLQSLRETWEQEPVTIRISALISCILQAEGVTDVTGVTVSGSGENLVLAEGQVPIYDSENSVFTYA